MNAIPIGGTSIVRYHEFNHNVRNNVLSGTVDVGIVSATPDFDTLASVVAALGGTRRSGPFERIRDIHHRPEGRRSVAESLRAHELHTDGTFEESPPRFFILQCVFADSGGGGVSQFVRIEQVLERLAVTKKCLLADVPVTFSRRDDSGRVDRYTGPLIYNRDDGKPGFRWRDDSEVSPIPAAACMDAMRNSLDAVRCAIRHAEVVEYQARPGDLIIVNNDTVLHGRSALSPGSTRHMRRAWIA